MADAWTRRDLVKEGRLYNALFEALNSFIREEPTAGSNSMLMAVLQQFSGNMLAFFGAMSLLDDDGVLGVSRGKCAVSYNWLYIKWLQWPVDRCDATDFAVQYEYTPLSG